MRILHTADWHLADRLGRIDRTDDLRRAVERVADYCRDEQVDVLLVAGDLFSELAGPEALRDSIRHLQEVFHGFLRRGGTILTLTGNHDKENFCQTLRHAMHLAAPVSDKAGDVVQPGRLYLATGPSLLRLADQQHGGQVQFILMPYPTPARYLLGEAAQKYQSLDEKNRHLMAAFTDKLHALRGDPLFDAALPAVLAAHVSVTGSSMDSLFRQNGTEEENLVLTDTATFTDFAYVALGHIHKPQFLSGKTHVRYSGGIERMDLGEAKDDKGVVVFDLGPKGLTSEPRVLPLETTRVYEITIHTPRVELSAYQDRYADAKRDLVRINCTYTAGLDNREDILRQLEAIFPRWYDRSIKEINELDGTLQAAGTGPVRGFEETVREYLTRELTNHAEDVRDAVLGRAETLMREMQE